MQIQEKFSYSAQPHAAPVKMKTKYRTDEEEEQFTNQNIMFDSRVVRGNTYSARTMSGGLKKDIETSKTMSIKKKNKNNNSLRKNVTTPPAVNGRTHMTMQTEDFLEEITDRPVEQDVETQTLPFMDRPSSPLFVRAKIGFDISTQIENGDLFDFDLEVEPLLEVLVGKTIHVSMLELMQEEELEAIRLQQEEFETIRNIELAEVQRLEAEIKRKEAEKQRRVAQEKKRLDERRQLEETIAARAFTNQFLGELHINVFDMLQEQGHFYDPVQKEVEELFIGDLLAGVVANANCYEAASEIAFELLRNAQLKAKSFEKEAIRLREELKEKVRQEELARLEEERIAREQAEAEAKAAEENNAETDD